MEISAYLLHADKKTVMICDDEIDLLNMYKTALQTNYDVIVVDSGKDCIDRYIAEHHSGKKIHVLLLDYRQFLVTLIYLKCSQNPGRKLSRP